MGQNKLGRMLHQIAILTGIDLSDDRKIVNHSCRRTAIQMLKEGDIPEDEIMEFSGHRSREGVRTYKSSDDARKIKNIVSLIPLDIEDIELEEFEYFPGNPLVNISDDESDSDGEINYYDHLNEGEQQYENLSNSSKADSSENLDLNEDDDMTQGNFIIRAV